MQIVTGSMAAERPGRYAKQLASHWATRGPVTQEDRATVLRHCLGALSPEAHEALAEAMNRLGARSNSGEGGEDPALRHHQELENQAGCDWPLRCDPGIPGQR